MVLFFFSFIFSGLLMLIEPVLSEAREMCFGS